MSRSVKQNNHHDITRKRNMINKSAKQPQHKINTGTLGPNPCQITLNKILIELQQPHITKLITSRYYGLQERLSRLKGIKPNGFAIQIMHLYYEKHIQSFQKHQSKMPSDAYSYALCCYKMLLKQAIRKINTHG